MKRLHVSLHEYIRMVRLEFNLEMHASWTGARALLSSPPLPTPLPPRHTFIHSRMNAALVRPFHVQRRRESDTDRQAEINAESWSGVSRSLRD